MKLKCNVIGRIKCINNIHSEPSTVKVLGRSQGIKLKTNRFAIYKITHSICLSSSKVNAMQYRTNRDKDAFDDLFNVLKTELNNGEYHIKLKSYYSEKDRKLFYDVMNVIHDTLPRDYSNVIFISKRYHGRSYDDELSKNIKNYPADSSCCKYVDIFFDLICCCRVLCYSCGEGTEYVIKHPTYVMKPGYGCTSGNSGVQVRTFIEGDSGAHPHEPIQPVLPN